MKKQNDKIISRNIHQELPYQMRQLCVQHREEIKTKNSGTKNQLWGGGGKSKEDTVLVGYEHHDEWS